MVERTERDRELIVKGLETSIEEEIHSARTLMGYETSFKTTKKILDKLDDYNSEIDSYKKEGLIFSEIFADIFTRGYEEIKDYTNGGSRNE